MSVSDPYKNTRCTKNGFLEYIGVFGNFFSKNKPKTRASLLVTLQNVELNVISKTPIAIISGTGKATDFKFGPYIHRVHRNKSPKFWSKGIVSVFQGLPKFFGYPLLSQDG